ncbi:cobalamin biosynthesis protein CobQ, partial [Lactobacillus sp. XV13L]|nr:cobalamin biosynthesis protein CobQ [Lactobacillus sp. XV13L]
MADKMIKIAYLYEDLMNTYGDSGDVKIIQFLMQKQDYETRVD